MVNNPLSHRDFEELRKKAYALRHNFFDDMEKHLLNLEGNLQKRGFNVVWAKDGNSLMESMDNLAKELDARRVGVDSKLPVDSLFKDMADVIPFDVVENSADDLDILVIDADLAVSDTGSLVFIERKSSCCFNKVKNMMVIVDIDQVIANQKDLTFFIALKNISKTDSFPKDVKVVQHQLNYILPSDVSFVSDQMYAQDEIKITVFLYMNDIEAIISSDIDLLKESLYCIKCGRCLEVCPVASAGEKLSPIDLIKLNCQDKYNRTEHVFSHTTLCGACDAVCPVQVPIVKLLLYEMQVSNQMVKPSRPKQLYSLFDKRSKLNKVNGSFFRYFFIKRFFGKNKNLCGYFQSQNGDFFNVTYQPPHEDNPNELIKDSDFE